MTATEIDATSRLAIYRKVQLTRQLETRLAELTKAGQVRGPMHTAVGQEVAAVGAVSCLASGDIVTTTHRPHGEYVGLDLDLTVMIAEMMGRSTGYCRGRAGHMLVASREHGLLGASGIVGQSLLIALGHAFAQRYLSEPNVTLCVTGDGACNSGAFNEVLNMAALWQLPLVILIVNNQYGLSVPLRAHSHETSLSKRGDGFGIPSARFDGNDLSEVLEHVGSAVDSVRAGGGPQLLEAVTYRRVGFSTSDVGGYQDSADLERYGDPVDRLRRELEAAGHSSDALAALDREIADQLEAAIAQASDAPWPTSDEMVPFIDRWEPMA